MKSTLKNQIIEKLKKDGFKIVKEEGVMIYAAKRKQTLVCSLLGSNPTFSISINGKPDLKSAKAVMNRVFPNHKEITPPFDILTANYFSLETVQ